MSGPPDLNLAVIGNCQIAALIDSGGSIVWACLPRLDGDPVFSALLSPVGEAERGAFCISLEGTVDIHQRYLRNTAIVETIHEGADASVKVTDFCPRFSSRERIYRPSMIIRIVEPIGGRPVIRVRLRPVGAYGSAVPRVTFSSHSVRFVADELTYRVTTDASLTAVYEERPFVLVAPLTFILGDDEPLNEAPAAFGRSQLDQTHRYWDQWVRGLAIPVDYQEAVIRAAITLKLCTFEDTGAVMAALTTSIPEAPDTVRNWDYRFCWLRDSYFTVHALNRLGATQTMEAYLRFIHNCHVRTPVGELQPLYGISGEAQLVEITAPSLRGYRGMGPVRVGNQAFEQKQYDVYGAIILAAAQVFYDERLDISDPEHLFTRLERLGEHAVQAFGIPDAGPWELRGTEAAHTFSAVMSWAGCDRLAQIATRIGKTEAAQHWQDQAARMHARIVAEAWNPKLNAFVATFGGEVLDATALLFAELGFVTAADPRFISTVSAIGEHLRCGDLLFRYRHADDFGVPTTTFTVCAFWYVNALAAVGRKDEARELFGKLLSRRTSLGLLSEDIDPVSGELWGNFPQTYSMVGIIVSALRLSRHWEDVL
ncbi:MAG TPA: glycoside hydrolase family 15 protein [Steroidobacteraceae bacterium]|nr:glycoside hydrolase family 15 protein [Steroidobacteraceae bacterium]